MGKLILKIAILTLSLAALIALIAILVKNKDKVVEQVQKGKAKVGEVIRKRKEKKTAEECAECEDVCDEACVSECEDACVCECECTEAPAEDAETEATAE